MTLQRLKEGAHLRGLSASTWNQFVAAAQLVESNQLDQLPGLAGGLRPPSLVRIRNGHSAKVKPFEILGLDEPAILPATNLAAFQAQIYFKGATPAIATHRRRWVVPIETISRDQYGLAVVSGAILAQVDIRSALHKRATLKDGDVAKLESDFWGCAEILWAANGTGVQWAIVRIGCHGGGLVRGKTSGPISANSTGTVTVWTGSGEGSTSTTTITGVYNPYADVADTRRVGVLWCDSAEQPELVAGEC